MVEAATNFRKSGFNNSDSAMLAQVAAQYQNIADTAVSASDAAASITSQIRAFGEDASFATTVINAYNEVANNFSVGTNDISNAMEIASSGMATYGNSFQQVIGLVTSGTEIMQGRASQVARGLSTIAARIVKNQDALAEYGIQVEKTDGSLKSTFDVLSELKPKWDAMTDAQRVALGDTIAGQNQYKVLASVMSNFQHAIDATNTALESAGSAAKENEAYMESLEAKENALKAEFEDFANRVLSKDVVKGFLEAGTSMLDFANNDVGAAISRIGLLATGMTGLTGIAGQTIGKIAEVGLQLKNLGVGGDSFLGMLASGKIALIVGGAVAAIALLAEAIRAIQNAYDEAHPSFEDANKNLQETQTEIQNTTAELEQYKQKIQELDAIDPKDRGAGWASERAELETNVQTAEAYLDVLKQIEQAQAGKIEDSKYVTGYTGQNVGDYSNGYIGTEASGQLAVTESQVKAITAEYTTQEEAVMSISLALKDYITGWETFQDMSMDDVVAELSDQLAALGINVHSTVETISQSFDNMGTLADKAADGFDELTKAEQDQATQYLSDYQAYVRGLIDSGNQLDAEQRREIQNYLNLSATSANFNRTQATTADTISFVASAFGITADSAANFAASIGYIDPTLTGVANNMVQLADGVWALKENCEQGADGLYYLKDGCDALAGSGDGAADALSQIEVATYDTSTAAAQLTASLFDQNGQLTEAGLQALSVDSSMRSLATSELQAQQTAAQANYAKLILEIQKVGSAAMITAGQLSQMMALAGVGSAQGLVGGLASGASTDIEGLKSAFFRSFGKSADANVADFNKWVSSRVSSAGQSTYDKIMEDTQKRLDEISKKFPTGGGGGGSSKKSAEEKAAEEAEKQAKKAQQAQEKAAKQSQQAYESAAKSAEQAAQEAARAAEQAAEEAKQKILDSIQELKDASDDFWDSKTDAIEETNKELDRQKQLEEKLKALEEAKQKKILLYKNGQFQYDKDYGTIAKAQADYEETRDKIQRERELEQLEEMKDNATEIFNEMKDIVQNGGDVTQEMINNWLKNMAASGADYYDSNKKLLGEWRDWAKENLSEFTQEIYDYISTPSLMSGGTYGSPIGGGSIDWTEYIGTDHADFEQKYSNTHGEFYRDSPYYWDEDGFIGFSKAFWVDRFKEQMTKYRLGYGNIRQDWIGNMPGTSILDDWKKVFEYWATDKDADIYALQDMIDRFDAAKIVFEYYKDVFKSYENPERFEEIRKQYEDIDTNELWTMARKMMVAANPTDPSGERKYIPAWRGTRTEDSAELYQVAMDLLYDFMGLNKTDADTWKNQFTDTALGEFFDTAKREWHINRADESDRYKYAIFDPEALKKALDENEEAIKQLNEKYFEAATDLDRQVIAAEAESRRKFRDLGYAQLGIDTTAQSEAERAANRKAGGTMEARQQQKKNAKNIESIEEVLKAVEKGQDISDEYINSARDYLANAIKENREASDKLYSETEKAKLEAQNAQMQDIANRLGDIQESGVSIKTTDLLEGETTPWDETTLADDLDDWLRDEDFDEEAEKGRAQMLENAEAWWQTEDPEERKRLHEENVNIAEEIGGLTYTGSTGKWSKNATGTHNFRGGLSLVGENGPELRVLTRGDNIIPANQTANLWKWSNTTPQQMLTTLSARSGGGNTSYTFDVSRIELPNVTDAKSFVQGLKNYALQYSYKR